MSFEWERMRPNFYRRYKWAFRPEYENINAPVVAQPALHEFMQACADILEVRLQPNFYPSLPTDCRRERSAHHRRNQYSLLLQSCRSSFGHRVLAAGQAIGRKNEYK